MYLYHIDEFSMLIRNERNTIAGTCKLKGVCYQAFKLTNFSSQMIAQYL